jgi:Conserved hypothetical protein (DUF2461)
MTFSGFRRSALDELGRLPSLDAVGYASRREQLNNGLIVPARALLDEVVAQLDAPLTTSARASVSPLHTDLRFAAASAPRYKDHLLLTTWHGSDKKFGPTLWIRVDSTSVGFASGVAFTPAVRERWRAAVAGTAGARLATLIDDLRKRHGHHDFEVAGDTVHRVPPPWTDAHPRSELLRKTGFQVRFRFQLPRESERPEFGPWCAERLHELLPAHRWLVKYIYSKDDPR